MVPIYSLIQSSNVLQLVTCTDITVPITIAPLGTAPFHNNSPTTSSTLLTNPLPTPPAIAPKTQHSANDLGGLSSGDVALDKNAYVPKQKTVSPTGSSMLLAPWAPSSKLMTQHRSQQSQLRRQRGSRSQAQVARERSSSAEST